MRVWDPETGAEVMSFQVDAPRGTDVEVWGPAFSPQADLLAAAWPAEGVVRIVEVASGDVQREIEVDDPFQTAFSPDGAQIGIATGGPGATGIVIAVDSGEQALTLEHDTDLHDISWSPDGRWILTSTFESQAHLFDAATGEPRFTLSGHTAAVNIVDWAADGSRIATASDDGTAKVWEVSDGTVQESLSLSAHDTVDGVTGVAFSPDGQRLLVGDREVATAAIWDVSVGGDAEWANVAVHPQAPVALAVAPGGDVVTSHPDAAAALWDPATGEVVRTLGPDSPPVDHVAVSHDGELVVGATFSGLVRAWDAATGRQLWQVEQDEVPINDAVIGRGRVAFATANEPGVVHLYDRSGQQVMTLEEGPGWRTWSIDITADGRRMAVLSGPERNQPGMARLRIYDLEQRRIVKTLAPGTGGVDFDPTGDRIVTADRGVATIWDIATGEQLHRLAGHTGDIYDTVFSDDGALVATTGNDASVRVWDARSGRQLHALSGHEVQVTIAAFSPDGSRLVSVGGESVARVWALDLDDLIAIARDELTRELTDQECREYLHTDGCAT